MEKWKARKYYYNKMDQKINSQLQDVNLKLKKVFIDNVYAIEKSAEKVLTAEKNLQSTQNEMNLWVKRAEVIFYSDLVFFFNIGIKKFLIFRCS